MHAWPPGKLHTGFSCVCTRVFSKAGHFSKAEHRTERATTPERQSCAARRDYDKIEHCPSCYNAQGPDEIKKRAIAETDPAALAAYGGGDQWPLIVSYNNGENAPNGETEVHEVAAQRVVNRASFIVFRARQCRG